MARKRRTPPEDMDRLAENLFNRYGDKIKDKDSFQFWYDKYMEGEDAADKLKPKVFVQYVKFTVKRDVPLREFQKFKKKEVVETFKPTDGTVRKEKKVFDKVGRVRKKVVFARKEFVVVRKKKLIRYRDAKGRFVSIKKK